MSIVSKNGVFRDSAGRDVILHGVNMVGKDYDNPECYGEEDFARVRSWGCNCVRYGILWNKVEPRPGFFDDAYLEIVRQRLDWAARYGLSVFLDMHQDCFSYSLEGQNGSTAEMDNLEWFARTDGLDHETPGSVWSDAYLTSPAVKRMNDNFWWNAAAVDGIGLQDHFIAAWKKVAETLGGHPALVGYNIFNEPNPGSLGERAMIPVLMKAAWILLVKKGRLCRSLDEVIQLWLNEESRQEMTALFNDVRVFKSILGAAGGVLRRAERKYLQPFYRKVSSEIRKADPDSMVLFEPFTAEFPGVVSGLKPLRDSGGVSDPNQAYVPHIYDIVVDTDNEDAFSSGRLESIAGCHRKNQKRMKCPVLIGEWGAYGETFGNARTARAHIDIFEKYLWGDTYWNYDRDTSERGRYFCGIHRAVLLNAPGEIRSMKTDHTRNIFSCSWEEDPGVREPAVIYIPGEPAGNSVRDDWGKEKTPFGVFLTIPGSGTGGLKRFSIRFIRADYRKITEPAGIPVQETE